MTLNAIRNKCCIFATFAAAISAAACDQPEWEEFSEDGEGVVEEADDDGIPHLGGLAVEPGEASAIELFPPVVTAFSWYKGQSPPGTWVRIWYQSNADFKVLGGYDPTSTPGSLSVGMRCFTALTL
jgi:hypothetical protein